MLLSNVKLLKTCCGLLLLWSTSLLMAQDFEHDIATIEASIAQAQRDFELQKKERNITKLLAISKVLYENNKKLKELKGESTTDKVRVVLNSSVPLHSLAVQDRLDVGITTQHRASEGYSPSALRYEVLKEGKSLMRKEKALYEKGGSHEERFGFEIMEPSDDYKVCATFVEEEKSYKQCASFAVKEPIKLEPLIIATSIEASHSDARILPGETLYVFAHYTNKTPEPLDATIVVKESKSGKILFEQQFTKEATLERKRMGVEIPASAYKEGDQLAIALHVKSASVRPIKQEGSIAVSSFEWSVSMPREVVEGEKQSFSLTPPKEFEAPLQLRVDTGRALRAVVNAGNPTQGNIEGLKANQSGDEYVNLFLSDAKGRKVSKVFDVTVHAKVAIAPKKEPEHLLFLPTQTPLASSSNTPSAATLPTEDSSWKTNIANDTKKIMQDYNKKIQEIDQKYATGTSKTKASSAPTSSAKSVDPWCAIALQDIAKYKQQYERYTQQFRAEYPSFIQRKAKENLEFAMKTKQAQFIEKTKKQIMQANDVFYRFPNELQCDELMRAVNKAMGWDFRSASNELRRLLGVCHNITDKYRVMKQIENDYNKSCK